MRRAGLLLCLALAPVLRASEAAAWLKIPQGARSTALGTAVTAVQGGAEGLWYNPAALGALRGADITVSRQAWLGDTKDDFVAVALPGNRACLGLFVDVVGTDDIYRDAVGNEGGSFHDGAWAGGLAGGLKLGWLNLGGAFKMLQERIADGQAAGYAGDLGLQARFGAPWLRLGFAAQNLGTFTGYGSGNGTLELPLTYRAGLCIDGGLRGLLLSVDARILPNSREAGLLAGMEYALDRGHWGAALRGGYDSAGNGAGPAAGLSVGGGLRIQNLKVDFTYTPYGALGNPYRMTLGWDFGAWSAAPPAAAEAAAAPAKPARQENGAGASAPVRPASVLPSTADAAPAALSAPAPAPAKAKAKPKARKKSKPKKSRRKKAAAAPKASPSPAAAPKTPPK